MTAAASRLRRRATGAGVATLVALGSAGVLAGPAHALPDFSLDRVEGADRYATSAAVSAKAFAAADTVVLANGTSEVDGLAAAYVAGGVAGPVLLTRTDTTPAEVLQEIERLGAGEVILVGGTSVISAAQEAALAQDLLVERVGGDNRYATAAAAALFFEGVPGSVFVASGTGAPDALAASPVSYSSGYPLLLTRRDGVPAETQAAMAELGTQTVVVLGGEAVVSPETYAALGGDTRLGGANRRATAVQVADWAIATEGFLEHAVGLARGDDLADALGAGAALGEVGHPLLLTQNPTTLGAEAQEYLQRRAGALGPLEDTSWVLGGTSAIADGVVAAAVAAGGGTTS